MKRLRPFLSAVTLMIAMNALAADLVPNPAVMTTEHADIFAAIYSGTLGLYEHDTDGGVYYLPHEVINYVSPLAKLTRPAGSQWNFLGVPAGESVWILPQSQNPNLLYAGASTLSAPGVFTGGITFQLWDMQGPGEFSLYTTNSFGTPTARMATSNGISPTTDRVTLAAPGHAHFNWAFTAPGIYQLDVSARGNFSGGAFIESRDPNSPTHYYFAVDKPLQVASPDIGTLFTLDSTSAATSMAPSSSGVLAPIAITYDYMGMRYAADAVLNQIVRLDYANQPTVIADSSDGVSTPFALASNASGEVFVANFNGGTILKIDQSGNVSVFADGTDGLIHPTGLAVSPSGDLFVSESTQQKIFKFDASGVASVFADRSDGILTPFGLTFDSAGDLYVADAALSTIHRFDLSGDRTVVGNLSNGVAMPTGVSFDPDGNLFVANYLTDQIMKMTTNGTWSVFADSSDGISRPFGIDFFDLNLPNAFGGGAAFRVEAASMVAAASVSVPEPSGLGLGMAAFALASWVRILRRRRRGVS